MDGFGDYLVEAASAHPMHSIHMSDRPRTKWRTNGFQIWSKSRHFSFFSLSLQWVYKYVSTFFQNCFMKPKKAHQRIQNDTIFFCLGGLGIVRLEIYVTGSVEFPLRCKGKRILLFLKFLGLLQSWPLGIS